MKKTITILMAIMVTLSIVRICSAVTFSGLYVFGDSLSDSGQFGLRATNPIDPADPGSETAMVWSQYLSQRLGLGELLPSTPLFGGPSGNNYAVVGLRSDEILASITDPNGSVVSYGPLIATRDGYLIEHPQPDPNALHVVWGGGNDLRDIRDARAAGGTQAALLADAQMTADNIVAGVVALNSAGTRYILVPNLPNIGDIPETNFIGGPAYVAAGRDATNACNERLLANLNASGANVIQVDINSLYNELLNDPTIFGFSSENHRIVAFDGTSFTGIPAAEGVNGAHSASPDPSRYVFYDGIHPTTYTAEIIAMYSHSIMEAPGQVSVLAEMPFSLARAHGNGIENHIRVMHATAQRGKYVPFVNSGYNWLDGDDTDATPGYDNSHYNLTAGLTYCFSDNLFAGVALGHNMASIDFDDDRGDFDLDGIFLSLLAGYQYGDLVLDVLGIAGDLDYDNIHRNVRLGPALRTHKGDTSGDYYAVKMILKLDLFRKQGFTMGPIAGINYQTVEVDGFREESSLSTSMNFHDQNRRSLLGSAGMFTTYDTQTQLGPLQLYGNIAYEEEFKDDDRYIRAGLNSLQGSSFELPAYEPETGFWRFDLGLNTEPVKNWVGAVSYGLHKGRDDSIGQGIQLTIQRIF